MTAMTGTVTTADTITTGTTGPTPTRPPAVAPFFSVAKVKAFQECPERYLRRYHVGPRRREPFGRAATRGKAAHAVLAAYAKRRGGPRATTAGALEEEVGRALPRALYPPEEAAHRDDDAETVLRQVAWGVEEFERRYGGATVLLVEEALVYHHRRPPDPAFALEARLDLLALHADGALEHADWKTGAFEPDATQNLVARVVVGRNASRLTAGRPFAGNEGIRTTAIFLDERRVWSQVYDRDAMHREWPALLEAVGAMIDGMGAPTVGTLPWLPRRSGLCGFCPFAADCSLNAATTDDAAMTAWLAGEEAMPPAA